MPQWTVISPIGAAGQNVLEYAVMEHKVVPGIVPTC